MNKNKYVSVIVPLALHNTYQYLIPDTILESFPSSASLIGYRVLVPFGNRILTALVVSEEDTPKVEKLKEILEVLDTKPLFNEPIQKLIRWMSDYYLCTLGEVIRGALPPILLASSKCYFKSNLTNEEIEKLKLSKNERAILNILEGKKQISLSYIKQQLKESSVYTSLKKLEEKNYIIKKIVLPKSKIKKKLTWQISLTDNITDDEEDKLRKRSPKQYEIIRQLAYNKKYTIDELSSSSKTPLTILKGLAKKELIKLEKIQIIRSAYQQITPQKIKELIPTKEQTKIIKKIGNLIQSETFHTILLYGITGSGKTYVYIQAIKEIIKQNKQAIVLVPEIALTPQTVQRFRNYFGERITVLHSRLSDGERFDAWEGIKKGDYDIVIGARSAVFAPLPNLGLIVLDEEHENSYKQSNPAPRYNAREVAIMRAKYTNSMVILGSATPTLETYYNSKIQKFVYTTLPKRIEERPLPPVTIVDMKKEIEENHWHLFSRLLHNKIQECLAKDEQILLLINRRGYSAFLQCFECGWIPICPNCDVSFTLHYHPRYLKCHYCDMTIPIPNTCPECKGYKLKARGKGTQKVEDELIKLFPSIKMARMDLDTTRGKEAHYHLLKQFETAQIDLLLGTQMIAKGLDFPNVTLVGVVAADIGLSLPDFRASERIFQLLTQVAGRTGRGELGGEVIIQTFRPEHYSITNACNHDYESFYEQSIRERNELSYPPFSRLIRLLIKGKNEKRANNAIEQLAKILKEIREKEKFLSFMQILGPAPAPLTKIKEQYRFHIIIKGKQSNELHKLVRKSLYQFKLPYLTYLNVDVDPQSML